MKSYNKKVIFLFILITLLPVLTLGTFSYKNTKLTIENELKKTKLDILSYTNKILITDFLKSLEKSLNEISYEVNFERLFQDETYQKRTLKNWSYRRKVQKNILFIYYGDSNNNVISVPDFIPPENYNTQKRPWFIQGKNNFGKISWTKSLYSEAQTNLPVISVTKGIYSKEGKFLGVLAFDISLMDFSQILKELDMDSNGYINLVGHKGDILISTEKKLIGQSIMQYDWGKSILNNEKNSQICKINNEKFYVLHETSPINRWKILALIPYNELKKQVEPIKNLTLYLGIISFLASLFFGIFYYEKKIIEAEDKNPLTNLYGNLKISTFIEEALKDKSSTYFLIYFDFNNFKAFNDKYGFKKGDEMILAFSTFLKRNYLRKDFLIGHIGGDDFFVGTKIKENTDFDYLCSKLNSKIRNFEKSIIKLYNEEDREQGYIFGKNREGCYQKIQLLTISTSILELPISRKRNTTFEDVSSIIFKLKNNSKESKKNISCASLI